MTTTSKGQLWIKASGTSPCPSVSSVKNTHPKENHIIAEIYIDERDEYNEYIRALGSLLCLSVPIFWNTQSGHEQWRATLFVKILLENQMKWSWQTKYANSQKKDQRPF